MRQIVVMLMAFWMGCCACMAKGAYWLYPLTKTPGQSTKKLRVQREAGFYAGLLACLLISYGVVFLFKKLISPYAFVEKGLLLLLCLYFMGSENESRYYLSAKIPYGWQEKAFLKNFALSIDALGINLLFLVFYWVILSINQTREWNSSFVALLLFGFLGIGATFALAGRRIGAPKMAADPMKEPGKWKNFLLLLMVAGLFV